MSFSDSHGKIKESSWADASFVRTTNRTISIQEEVSRTATMYDPTKNQKLTINRHPRPEINWNTEEKIFPKERNFQQTENWQDEEIQQVKK